MKNSDAEEINFHVEQIVLDVEEIPTHGEQIVINEEERTLNASARGVLHI
ncbi:hypothetical protein [Chryseomicrobium excrementi]|nr:hypothetical protein [Chryseomicrobium excrementi]